MPHARTSNPFKSPVSAFLLARVSGHALVVLLCLLLPEVGPNRFAVAALLLIAIPLAVIVSVRFNASDGMWIDALFDLVLTVTLVHFIPQVWHAALCIGLMVALAPGLSLHPRSPSIYLLLGCVLAAGMTLAAVVHNIENWLLPMLAFLAVFPPIIAYAHFQLRRANRLRGRSELLDHVTALSGGIAHDFNNTLMSISGQAELALLDLGDNHPATRRLRDVVEAVERASRLSDQLLAFANRDSDDEHRWDLVAEVKTLAALLRPVVPPNVDIQVHASVREAHVLVDRAKLQQVLMHAILNAGEAMRAVPGAVTINVRCEDASTDQPHVAVEITDNGLQSNARTPFVTASESSHGLGLATAQRLMESQGGKIACKEKQGEGTTIFISLPLATPPVTSAGAQTAPGTEDSRTALVVDDEIAVLGVTTQLLERLGYHVIQATSADEAIAVYAHRSASLSLVMLDLNMPGKDGWQCLDEMREIDASVPVIICSGFDPAVTGDRMEKDAVIYLPKPFRLDELRTALSSALSRS